MWLRRGCFRPVPTCSTSCCIEIVLCKMHIDLIRILEWDGRSTGESIKVLDSDTSIISMPTSSRTTRISFQLSWYEIHGRGSSPCAAFDIRHIGFMVRTYDTVLRFNELFARRPHSTRILLYRTSDILTSFYILFVMILIIEMSTLTDVRILLLRSSS